MLGAAGERPPVAVAPACAGAEGDADVAEIGEDLSFGEGDGDAKGDCKEDSPDEEIGEA